MEVTTVSPLGRFSIEVFSYHCTVDDLVATFKKHDLFEKNNYIKEEHLRNLYRIVHLGIYQNPILPKWHNGRVCLIGDAGRSYLRI